MAVQGKGEFETTYFGGPDNPALCGGVNYSVPYSSIPPTDLAPGTVNTQSINGFLCSSPWVAEPPFNLTLTGNEFVLGTFNFSFAGESGGGSGYATIVVTNVAVYKHAYAEAISTQISLGTPSVLHTWTSGTDIFPALYSPGNAVSFLQLNGILYFTGVMLSGLFCWNPGAGTPFSQCTDYVAGSYLAELAGRMVIAECIFPTGGGTGNTVQPTIAWSGVGVYGQAWDGNSAHDVWNAANLNYFDGNIGGFNLLGDVPDQITGIGTVGQSIMVVRQNGVTQQDPNSTYSSSGIQPYNWYHLWSSETGVGGGKGTVAQYGQTLTFQSSDNVYSLSMSGGLTPIGNKIIARILSDIRTIANLPAVINSDGIAFPTYWNFASIYNLDGQLHYILTLSSYQAVPSAAPSSITSSCYAYDFNMAESSWHVWDFSQYYTHPSHFLPAVAPFFGFSCPLVFHNVAYTGTYTNLITGSNPPSYLIGTFTNYGTLGASTGYVGTLFQLVPYDYDYNSNWITNFVALLYASYAIQSTTIYFRGEQVSLGHRLRTRRLRIQADNAPIPSAATGAQQQAQVTMIGTDTNSYSYSPTINMQGNLPPTGGAIRTYYGDAILADEMVQPSVTSVFASANPWQTICAFRISSASLIGNDMEATTQ